MERKKNLFGMGDRSQHSRFENKGAKSQGRLNEEEQKEREYFTRDLSHGPLVGENMGGSGGAQNLYRAFMGNDSNDGSVREVTQESGIEVLEGVLTRKRRMAAPK
mmetsp:Transcript_3149/g.3044  ORF Transcript_3149/g.3044 Transcript_3149/m.3044 type:complete len:105 (-) Transcript_3149:579-893(-)